MNKKLILTILFLSGMMVLGGTLVRPATIQVATTQDNREAGSLRAAISTANHNSEETTIYLPAGRYILGGTIDEDDNTGGDLDIAAYHTVRIIGDSPGTTIIEGAGTDRVMHILDGIVYISNVTIRNGKIPRNSTGSGNADHGGGINNSGELTLANCIISNSRTGDGSDCVSNDSPYGKNGGNGGGIANFGILTLRNCEVRDNTTGDGGAAFSHPGTGLSCNYAGDGGDGGGIYNCNTLTLIESSIHDNQTGDGGDSGYLSGGCTETGDGGKGGGIYNSGTLWVTRCDISKNITGSAVYSGSDAGCGGNGGFGGGIFSSGTLSLTESTLHHNSTGSGKLGDICDMGEGGHGAGLFSSGNGTQIINCTISGNLTYNYLSADSSTDLANQTNQTTLADSPAVAANGIGSGGGIYNKGKNLTLKNCTITDNKTGNPAWSYSGGNGGGIYNDPAGSVKMKNTLLANNRLSASGTGPDGYGTFESLGYNLIENNSHCIITGILTGNITGTDPKLDSLKNNGGPTLTHALLPDSPAIDAGNSAGITTDQRGHARPVDLLAVPNVSDGSDIGAYELDTTYSISGQVTYGETGLAGVTLTFSNQGGTATTDDDGNYSQAVPYDWTGTVTPSFPNYVFTPASRSYTNVTAAQQDQDYSAAVIIPPRIVLDRTQLNFGTDTTGHQTGMQTLIITNGGGGILTWTISDNAQWLNCTPTSGTGAAVITVTVEPTGLSAGTYTATITVAATGAVNSPQTVQVTLTVYNPDVVNPPFGSFDTPLEGSVVTGSIPVTGWVIDNLGVDSVKIYRVPVEGEGSGWIYIGDAIRIEGARPDIETLYPGYPENYQAGWGYMMLTHFLPNQGNGTFTLYARAADIEGHTVTLGTKTITCDNAHAVRPFGAIDTPAQGGIASGSHYLNYGWALTPPPNTVPTDGSTIQVWVDGVSLGNPVYNQYREDVAALFPGYNNSNGAGGYLSLDTAGYENGVHTIFWTAMDNAGNIDGIGSRYFTIQNLAGSMAQENGGRPTELFVGASCNYKKFLEVQEPFYQKGSWPPEALLFFQRGYNPECELETLYPDENGQYTIKIKELARLVIYLEDSETESDSGEYKIRPYKGFIDEGRGEPGVQPAFSNSHLTPNTEHLALKNTPSNDYEGYLVNGDELKPLPIGTTLDGVRGVFYWQPGPGFLGTYRLVFIKRDQQGNLTGRDIWVTINPKGIKNEG